MDENGIVSHLPALLRYARGLTLSDTEGEAVVEATLRALLSGEMRLDTGKPLLAALLQQVHRNWIPLDRAPDVASDADAGLFGPLARAAPEDRAALLLVRFEGLSESVAAAVIDVAESDLRRRLARAERRVFRMARPRLLIVESKDRTALLDWDDIAAEADCEWAGPVGFEDAAAAAGSEMPDTVVVALADDMPAAELTIAESMSFRQNTPLVLLAMAPAQLPNLPWIDSDCVVAPPFAPTAVAGAIQRALKGGQAKRLLNASEGR